MVSIRKRRHLGIQERYKILSQISRLCAPQQTLPETRLVIIKSPAEVQSVATPESPMESKPDNMIIMPQPIPSPTEEATSSKEMNNTRQGLSMKYRKSSRRKQPDNNSCMLRGVYYKNMKWQAAIKVEKKQIHLGTVASMEEAAHLYDRAAYLCGRVPNFELSEEEKQELHGLQWEEFLLMTKEAIASKKKKKRIETSIRRRRTAVPGEDVEIDGHPIYHTEAESNFHPPSSMDEHAPFHNSKKYPDSSSFIYPSSIQFSGDIA